MFRPMSSLNESRARAGAPWSWRAFPALAIVAVLGLQALLAGPRALVQRPMWLDEQHTWLLVTREGWRASLTSLARGADTNPPLLYLVLRCLHALGMPLSATSLRVTTFAFVAAAVVLLYGVLARRFGAWAGAAGTAASWCNPLVQTHAFEVRFYGAMLLLAAALAAVADAPRLSTPWRVVLLAALSAALCTVHWFGAVVLGLAGGGLALWCLMTRTRPWAWLVPLAAGPLALAACLPLLRGQRAAVTVPTWIEPATRTDVLLAFGHLYMVLDLALVAVAVIAVWGVLRLWQRRTAPSAPSPSAASTRAGAVLRAAAEGPGVWMLAACALFPMFLLGFSILVQPSLIERYAIVTSLGVAVLVAAAAAALPPVAGLPSAPQWTAVVVLLAGAMVHLRHLARRNAEFAGWVERTETGVTNNVPRGATVLVTSRHALYPTATTLERAGYRVVYPDFAASDSVCTGPLRGRRCNGVLLERDIARVHAARYAFPTLAPIDSVRRLPSLYVVGNNADFVARLLPAYALRPLAPDVFLAQRPRP